MSEILPPEPGGPTGALRRPIRRVGQRPGAGAYGPSTQLPAADGSSTPQVDSTALGPRGADFDIQPPRTEDVDPRRERRAERTVGLLFILSAAGTIGFLATYVFGKLHTGDYGARMNALLAITLTISMFGIGAGLIVWAKKLMPHETAVQQREPFASPQAERLKTEEAFFTGTESTGIGRRSIIRRSMALALGVLPLAALFPLRDLGPAPHKTLRRTAWKSGVRLVDAETKRPIKLGDLPIGSLFTVMPEGFDEISVEERATSPTLLIRLRPDEVRQPGARQNWTVDGHVAYSAICTHAGCPVKLYERQTHHLFCPCHQSTFDVLDSCRVLFGPAARSLPQLAISTDSDGYFIADGDYTEPVGPSFWERG
jgi:ubiquinol-cytochrome c reductase iron-sulfur subunit